MKKILTLALVAQLQLTAGQVQQLQSLLAQMSAVLAPAPPANTMTFVGNDLQAALNASKGGDILVLAAGSVYTGDYVLPTKTGLVTVTSSAPPPPGVRVSPTSVGFARIVAKDSGAALATAPGIGGGWTLIGLEVAGDGGSDLILLGDGSAAQNSLTLVPGNLTLDRLYAHGSDANGRKRCIALNSASTTIKNSYIANCKLAGQDSQAIAGWNGPGPYTISNNYLESAGDNFILGGSDPAIPNLISSDVAITGNTFNKPIAWRGQGWQIKNHLELKNAQRVSITGNTFSYTWADAQTGYSVLFTPRNQDGGCPWCVVQHVTMSGNTFAHLGAWVQILGTDNDHPSQQANDITIANNVVTDLDPIAWASPSGAAAAGRVFLLTSASAGVVVDHNSVSGQHLNSFQSWSGTPSTGLRFTNNIMPEGDYGIAGDGTGQGSAALAVFSPTAVVTNNAIVKTQTDRTITYPAGNYVVAPGAATGGLTTTDGKPIGSGQQ